MDSNHDKVIQSHLCYRYTTRHRVKGEIIRGGQVYQLRKKSLLLRLLLLEQGEDGFGGLAVGE